MIPRVLAFTCVALLAMTPLLRGQADAPQPPGARVLFIGNSLTAVNNLPAMVEALAEQTGLGGRIFCRAVALPDFGLEEHWNDGGARRAIAEGRWTLVVLQQGPTSLPESQAILRQYTKKFADEIRRSGARVALFSVWPPSSRAGSFDAVTASYARAADDVGGMLIPVGEGWRAAWRREPALRLYGGDGFHPSPAGTYLGALMFYQRLTGRSPVGLPGPGGSKHAAFQGLAIDGAQLRVLQDAADEANARVQDPAGHKGR